MQSSPNPSHLASLKSKGRMACTNEIEGRYMALFEPYFHDYFEPTVLEVTFTPEGKLRATIEHVVESNLDAVGFLKIRGFELTSEEILALQTTP